MLPKGQTFGLLVSAHPIYAIPVRAKHIPPHKKRFQGDGDLSQTNPGKLTDIRYYQALDKSHLHKWDARSPKRKFLLKLEEMEKRKFFSKETTASHTSLKSSEINHNRDQSTLQMEENIEDKTPIDPIILPSYIERSPSSILRVLASCVVRDKTAPDYKYHDDPFLIPYNSIQKRDYILAKDGGKKAARYVLDNHPELFEKNLIYDEPKIR